MKSTYNWALMLTYNLLSFTRDAVATALEQDVPMRLLVMDDGSTDGTINYLRTLHPKVQLVTYKGAGVSYLWNRGLAYLFDTHEVPYVLVLNNDIRLRPDTFRLLAADGGQFVTCVGTSSGASFPGGVPSGRKRPHPDFSAYMIRHECWKKVGPFDESMKIYASDGDMHLRLHRAGIEAVSLDLPFFHVASGTLKEADPEDRGRILAQAQADRAAFSRKWGFEMGSSEYYATFKQKTEAPSLEPLT